MQVVHLGTEALFKGQHFSDENPPTEKDLREYFNSGDEVGTYCKLLSQEQKERGSHVKFYYHLWMIAIKR